tara:strand:- start:45 stop:191 length:147 start_codon:yes stop_codon:yes gene_type:complete
MIISKDGFNGMKISGLILDSLSRVQGLKLNVSSICHILHQGLNNFDIQ